MYLHLADVYAGNVTHRRDFSSKFVAVKNRKTKDVIEGTRVCTFSDDSVGSKTPKQLRDGCNYVFVITYATKDSLNPGVCYMLASSLMAGIKPFILGWDAQW